MNSLHIANRHAAQAHAAIPVSPASSKGAKSSVSSGSAPFSQTLQELQAPESPAPAPSGVGTGRQNPVTSATNSRIAAVVVPAADAAPAAGNAPMTREQARIILATGQGDVVTANQVYYGSQTASNSAVKGATGTGFSPGGAPAMYTPGQSSSTDPSVYSTPGYMKALLYSGIQQQANAENARRYQNYSTAVKNWEAGGSVGSAPALPQYETVDQGAFDQWWSQYQASIATGDGSAPDVKMFLTNAPNYGNGYYGTPGTAEVGTLYGATGPGRNA